MVVVAAVAAVVVAVVIVDVVVAAFVVVVAVFVFVRIGLVLGLVLGLVHVLVLVFVFVFVVLVILVVIVCVLVFAIVCDLFACFEAKLAERKELLLDCHCFNAYVLRQPLFACIMDLRGPLVCYMCLIVCFVLHVRIMFVSHYLSLPCFFLTKYVCFFFVCLCFCYCFAERGG